MATEKTTRSYILQSVISKNGSWNNDFNGSPKQYDDQFFASDRALKYAVRHLMEQMGKNVLIKKWVKGIKSGKKETNPSEYEVMNQADLKKHIKETTGKDFHQAFWDFEDVRQFGMLYDNLNVHGVAQISQGLDLFGEGVLYRDELTGRMVFSTKGDSDKETRGMATREFLSEAHFVYDISVNPANVHFLKEIPGYEDCYYTEEDYQTLLECLENGPHNVKSTQKLNVNTGFMCRIDLKEGVKVLLGNLQGKLRIVESEEEGKVVYDVSELFKYLRNKQDHSEEEIFEAVHISYEGSEIVLKGVDKGVDNVTIEEY